ncbi:hypothetical protein ACTNB5_18290, partial [Phocaeicola vulgatus]|uniref:hypothetical protein n=1 Tax=Phocaeicola vulgatus TaxID=821 RepID=UPI003F8C8BA9
VVLSCKFFRETKWVNPERVALVPRQRSAPRPAPPRRTADTGKGAHGASLRGRQPLGYPAQAA